MANDLQPEDYEHHFDASGNQPISLDEVVGDRDLCIAFDYEPRDDGDMVREGYWPHLFAKSATDTEWEEITHLLLSRAEEKWLLDACVEHNKPRTFRVRTNVGSWNGIFASGSDAVIDALSRGASYASALRMAA
ncbi:hypothetical protein [Limnohabitans sp.]|uniref:hypothetical protein n=1 Tax=Limnohabitans sp. TaxID=1907725 RepID=UPI00286EF0D6|nr:hypothetical protein [Limnohabitans sp.]